MTDRRHRLGFAGTPELAATILETLLNGPYDVSIVYTQPDRESGRGRKLTQSPVKSVAESHQLPLCQPHTAAEIDKLKLKSLDVLIVAAYGMLLPAGLLNLPKHGCINIHTSLLPRWRGAAPIQRAIAAGDRETGITIMQMDVGLDTGDILLQRRCPIHADDTAGTLRDRLTHLGTESLQQALVDLFSGNLTRRRQEQEQATYAHKISKDEARIDWSRSALEIERCIRAFNPVPVAHTALNGMEMRVWEAQVINRESGGVPPGGIIANETDEIVVATGKQLLGIRHLQLPGKKICSARDFRNGHPEFMGPHK